MNRLLATLAQKWPEYILEILVLIIGIFGAIELENWNEERKERNQEIEILKGLKEEFELNLNLVNQDIEANSKVIEATVKMIALMQSELRFSNQELLDSLLFRVNAFASFDCQTGFVDDVINSGKLSLIQDIELRKKLSGLSSEIDNIEEDYVVRLEYYSYHIMPMLSRYFNMANVDRLWDFSHWSTSFKTKTIPRSNFRPKYDEIDLLELENALAYHKVNNDFVNLDEQRMRDYFIETLEIINRNIAEK